MAHRAIQRIFTAALKGEDGGLAQLARALAWHARGHRFDSDILHPYRTDGVPQGAPFFVDWERNGGDLTEHSVTFRNS